jgi:hypothetical protein
MPLQVLVDVLEVARLVDPEGLVEAPALQVVR